MFISALDFKEKSIQVIRKTPEKFVEEGWKVDYIILRDNSILDNYEYEKEINPPGIKVFRLYLRFLWLMSVTRNYRILRRPIQKLSYTYGLFQIVFFVLLNKKKICNYQVVYGYEVQGVLALRILRFLGLFNKALFVTRFQGSFLYDYIINRKILKLIGSLDDLIAFIVRADITIITNDGTMADKAFKILNQKSQTKLRFWPNGSDFVSNSSNKLDDTNENGSNKITFLTVSRLVNWKRVDRAIRLVSYLSKKIDCNLIIVGDGPAKNNLETLVKELKVGTRVVFEGAVDASNVQSYFSKADFFLSFYEGSNVGNPLFEAIRNNKIVCTLSNGDTSNWIDHKNTGLIYDDFESNIDNIITDILFLISNTDSQIEIRNNIRKLEKLKLKTWEERMDDEYREIIKLIEF